MDVSEKTQGSKNGKNDLTLSLPGPRNERIVLFLSFLFVVAETKQNHIRRHNLGTGSRRGQLVTD